MQFVYLIIESFVHQKLKIRKVHADVFNVTALNFINVQVNKLMDCMLAQAIQYQRRRLFFMALH